MSKRVNLIGAAASVSAGVAISTVFADDELIGFELGEKTFPFLHHPLTLDYTCRGLWGTLAIIAVSFGVSLATRPPAPENVERTTIRWGQKWESFRGWSDWRLQWAVLALMTVTIYRWLW